MRSPADKSQPALSCHTRHSGISHAPIPTTWSVLRTCSVMQPGHGLLLEGGFDDNGNFVYLPISSTKHPGRFASATLLGHAAWMAELFRRKMIWYFEKNKLLNTDFALNLLSWKNSGFSIDNSVRIYGSDNKARESLAQYITRSGHFASLRCSTMHPGRLFHWKN